MQCSDFGGNRVRQAFSSKGSVLTESTGVTWLVLRAQRCPHCRSEPRLGLCPSLAPHSPWLQGSHVHMGWPERANPAQRQ